MAAPSGAKRLKHPPPPASLQMAQEAAGGGGDDEPSPEMEAQLQCLLPGLPDHLAQLCLSPLPPTLLYAVCRSWRRLLFSPSFPPFLSLYALLDDTTAAAAATATCTVSFCSYVPFTGRWEPLPAPPLPSPPPLLRHPSFISRRLPLQSVAAAGRLVLVAGSTASLLPALDRPLVFDPAASPPRWLHGPPFPLSPRRWCAAGAAQGRVLVAGGVGSGYDPALARSAAAWDPSSDGAAPWEALPPLRDGRFSREAAEAVCAGGKVCMVNLRGRGAKGGAVYDLRARRWEEMPPGMLAGWKGPAAAAAEGEMYVVDEERGAVGVYQWGRDRWRTVAESEGLKGAAEMAAGGGKVCVVAEGGERVVVVDVSPSRRSKASEEGEGKMWVVEAPEGRRVVALHVLPRMSPIPSHPP